MFCVSIMVDRGSILSAREKLIEIVKKFTVLCKYGLLAYGRSGPMDAAMNRVVQKFGTRDIICLNR